MKLMQAIRTIEENGRMKSIEEHRKMNLVQLHLSLSGMQEN